MANKYLYYFIQWTWGLPMNVIGLISYLFCLIILKYSYCKYKNAIIIKVPYSFSGLNLGMFIFLNEDSFLNNKYLTNHEYGHSIQNIYYGLLFPFLVGIPSIVRHYYRLFLIKKGCKLKTNYYDIWFEKQASELGEKYSNENS